MFIELARKRRSIRTFTSQQVEKEKIDAILEAALRAPSGRGTRPWALIVVTEKDSLEKLSAAKPGGAAFLKEAPVAIVVCGDPSKSRLWIEDCAILAVTLQYAAHSLELGSCWSQMRGNKTEGGISSRDYIAELLDLPDNLEVECIVGMGYPAQAPTPYRKEELAYDRVSYSRHGQG